MSQLHYDLLDRPRQGVFEKLKFLKKDAVLAGGTALFLQIGHRLSFDFDLFLEREIKRQDFLKLKKIFEIKEIRLNTSTQLNIITKEDILITLIYYPYKSLFEKASSISLSLFSVKDIALDKAFTIGRRATWRDYIDLFFILKKNYLDISEIIKLAEKKFGVEFNSRLFLEQLIYFNDLEIIKISFVKKEYGPQEIKNFLEQQVKNFKKSRISFLLGKKPKFC